MKNIYKVSAVLMVICTLFTVFTFHGSAVNNIYSNLKIERIKSFRNVPVDTSLYDPNSYPENTNTNYTNLSGIAIGKSHDSLFVVKSNDIVTDTAILYYYPNFSVSNTCAELILEVAGHANGMAIDDNNVYVTSASNFNSSLNGSILKIPRSTIAHYAAIKYANPNQDVTIPLYETGATGSYYCYLIPSYYGDISTGQPTAVYNGNIGRITCYDGNNESRNGNFIVNYKIQGNTNDYYKNTAYTRAKLVTYSGNEILLLSDSISDIFLVKNTMASTDYYNANIYYSATCGFYDPKFDNTQVDTYGRRTKNIILWADIDGTPSYTTINGISYRYFVPDKVNLNVKNAVDSSVSSTIKMYYKFEIESIAFDENNDLFLGANVAFTSSNDDSPYDYVTAYKNLYGVKPIGDGVFKLTRYADNDTSQTTPLSWEL